jgi:hypothetical protein
MNYEDVKKAWNAQADGYNDWTSLSADEMVEFAISIEREECAKICMKQQKDLKCRQLFASAIRSKA